MAGTFIELLKALFLNITKTEVDQKLNLNSINGRNFKYLVYSLNGDSHHKYMLENISFQRPTYDTARKGHSLLGGSCPLPF